MQRKNLAAFSVGLTTALVVIGSAAPASASATCVDVGHIPDPQGGARPLATACAAAYPPSEGVYASVCVADYSGYNCYYTP